MSTAEDTQIWLAFYNDKAPSGSQKGKYFLATRFYCMIPEDIAPDLDATWVARVQYRTLIKGAERTVDAKPNKVWQGASGFVGGKARLNVVQIDQEFVSGDILLHIEWTAKDTGDAHILNREFPAGNVLNARGHVELASYDAPVLSEQINSHTPSPVSVGAPSDDEGRMVGIMKHVYAKLDFGLGEVWGSFPGILRAKDGRALSDVASPSDLSRQELDECWAQLVAERLILTPYGGPGPNYRSGGSDEEVFVKAIDEADPGIPLLCACQQLCTMAAIMRGFDDAAMHVVSATSGANMNLWAAEYPARFESGAEWRTSEYSIEHGLEPCSAFVVPVGTFPHIAFVLRAFESKTFQFIDTGALRSESQDPRGPEIYPNPLRCGVAGRHGGANYDTGARTGVRAGVYRSVAIAPRVSDDKLKSAIERTRKSRPLGFARLIVLNREGSQPSDAALETRLRWATPLLPMWEASDAKKNYPIARYFWSLRDHPFRDVFEARWLFYIPVDLLDGGRWRYQTMTAVRSTRAFRWSPTEATRGTSGVGVTPVLSLASSSDGSVCIVGRFAASPHNWQNYFSPNPNYDPRNHPHEPEYLTSQPPVIARMPVGCELPELNVLHRVAGVINAMPTSTTLSVEIPAYFRGDR